MTNRIVAVTANHVKANTKGNSPEFIAGEVADWFAIQGQDWDEAYAVAIAYARARERHPAGKALR